MASNSTNRARQLNRLIELNHLSAQMEAATIFQSLVEMGAELTNSEYSSILAFDSEIHALKFIAGPWLQMPRLKTMVVPLDGSIAGNTFKTNEPAILSSADKDPNLFRPVQEALGIRTNTLLSVPIRFRGNVLGVMQAVNKYEGDYDHEDTAFLLSLGAQAATAMHIQRLEQEINHWIEHAEMMKQREHNFISIASHELRTPLGIMLGNATFLREMIQSPDLRPQVEAIIISGIRLKEVIETLTRVDNSASGTARLRSAQVNMNQLVEDLVTSYQSEAQRKGITLSVELHSSTVLVEGEADKIGVALQNILRNAIAFTGEGGSIHVVLRKINDYAQLSVSDTGIGIPEEEQGRIFDRFYQVESHLTRRHGGMGLGLSVAKNMIEMHGGQIWVTSKPNQGSTFTIVIPEKHSELVTEEIEPE